jgi:DHA2 family multidrug resistance protein
MLEELLGYPVDTTGYMTLPRGVALVATLIATSFLPARIDSRWLVVVGLTLVGYATWRMVGYSPTMDGRPVAVAGLLQGVGLGLVLPALTKTAFATLDPKLRPEGTELFNLSRLYGSTLGIAVVQVFFYNNTQAVHLALAKHLTPYRAAGPLSDVISQAGLASLNNAVSSQAAFVAVIDQFKLLTIVVLIAVPLALALRPPHASA